MKKKVKIMAGTLLATMLLTNNVFAYNIQKVSVDINDMLQPIKSKVINKDGHILVAFRELFDILGAKVKWNDIKRDIEAKKGNYNIIIDVDSDKMKFNDKYYDIDVEILDGTTYVGLRTICEALGMKVNWEEAKNNISIDTNQKGIPYDKIKICWNFLKYTNVYCDKPNYINLKWTTAKGEEKSKEKLDASKLVSTLKASVKTLLKADGFNKEQIESFISEMEEANSIDMLPDSVKLKIHIEKCKVQNKSRQIERSKIGESLQANVKSQMKKLGYTDDQIFTYLDQLIQTNNIKCLPEDVQSKYEFSDCYVYVDLTDELIQYWQNEIIETTKMIRQKEAKWEKTHDESIWMESQEDVKLNSYYFSNLCSYSANKHKPYKIYLQTLEAEKNGDLLGSTQKESEYAEDDLSWLQDLL